MKYGAVLRCRRVTRYHVGPLLLFAALSVYRPARWYCTWARKCPATQETTTSSFGISGGREHVLASPDLSFFHTPYLFAPFSAASVNHPHTPALQGFFAATVLARVELVAALNLVILLSVFANFACAYWLTWVRHRARSTRGDARRGRLRRLALRAPAHLLGHFDLISAWVLPLFGLCLRRALATGGTRWMIGCGVVLALAAYTAYYYVVYLGLMAGAYVIGHLSLPHFRMEARLPTARTRTIRWAGAIPPACSTQRSSRGSARLAGAPGRLWDAQCRSIRSKTP